MRRMFAILLGLILLCGVALAEGATVEVRSGWLNLRASASEDAEILGKLKNGTRIEVDAGQDLLFAAVLSGESVIGWVSKSYIILDSQVAYEKHFDYRTFRLLTDYNATDLPTGDGVVILSLKAGDIVEGRISTATHIHLKGGGFVPKTALEEIE